MALITKKKFAELAGVDTSYLSKYIKRRKVIAINDLIDDQEPQNIFFLETRINKRTESKTDNDHDNSQQGFDSDNFKTNLENEYLSSNNETYDVTKEKQLVAFNNDLLGGNKVMPRMIVDNMANGSIIEICAIFFNREMVLRKQLELNTNKIENYYETICRNKILQLGKSIDEVMADLEADHHNQG